MYTIQEVQKRIGATGHLVINNHIAYLLTDSRKVIFPEQSLFFALSGPRRNGHLYIDDVYHKGVRNFVVKEAVVTDNYPEANFLYVSDVLKALQQLASSHRAQFSYPVIGITGSNGKTIVKEWLYQLLQHQYKIVRSPRSYNSQIGVPLSVWEMQSQHNLAIFEAGISTTNEMDQLASIIQPDIGILTNIGEAHKEGFANIEEKLLEKLKLFRGAKQLVFCREDVDGLLDIHQVASLANVNLFSWSRNSEATLRVEKEIRNGLSTAVTFLYAQQTWVFQVPFTDKASINNAISCCCVLLLLQIDVQDIQLRMQQLQPVEMRMQLKKALNNCYVLNDSYSNDVSSLTIALDFLKQQSGQHTTTVILSDILQSGTLPHALYAHVAQLLKQYGIGKLIGIGNVMVQYQEVLRQAVPSVAMYHSTQAFLQHESQQQFHDEYILIKGARVFAFEQIDQWFAQKVHQTIMEINLNAMAHNLKQYQQFLQPSTKLMAMVKAFSYGNGSSEVARLLQFNKVDYLAVAYADEGVELRNAGITLPIMVMNADEASFHSLIEYNLEPEIYSCYIYYAFDGYLKKQGLHHFLVHFKINTGMNRLGFEPAELSEIGEHLAQFQTMLVKTAFSHLVGSEDPLCDDFTRHQAHVFDLATIQLEKLLGYTFMKHIANSSGIFRHPNLQYQMVRLGIGLYGVDSHNGRFVQLETVATLKSTIAQIRVIQPTDTVGYNRRGTVEKQSRIATIRIGYADGFSRRLGNGVGAVYIHGCLAKVIGNVCMDMIMVDVTNVAEAKEGDVVEVFGGHIPIQEVAKQCGTIAYEIMTGISQRVKRIYIEE